MNAGSRLAASCRVDVAIPGAGADELSGLMALATENVEALREPATVERIWLEDGSRVDAGSEYSRMLPALTGTAGVGADCSDIESCATSCAADCGSTALALRELATADCIKLEGRACAVAGSEDSLMLSALSTRVDVAGDCSDIEDGGTSRVTGSGSVALALAFTENDGNAGVHGRSEGEVAAVELTGAGRVSLVFLDETFLLDATFEVSTWETESPARSGKLW